jgi:hypothetical protein
MPDDVRKIDIRHFFQCCSTQTDRVFEFSRLATWQKSSAAIQSPRFDHFAWVSGFFKPKAIRPVELAPVANTMIYQALQETAGAVPA